MWVDNNQKKSQLFKVLWNEKTYVPPIVVFVNSRKGAELLADAISKVNNIK